MKASDRAMILLDEVPAYVAVGFVDERVALERGRLREAWMTERYGADWERKMRERAQKGSEPVESEPARLKEDEMEIDASPPRVEPKNQKSKLLERWGPNGSEAMHRRGLNRDTVAAAGLRSAKADSQEAPESKLRDSGTSTGDSHGRPGNADHAPADSKALDPRRAPTATLPGESASDRRKERKTGAPGTVSSPQIEGDLFA